MYVVITEDCQPSEHAEHAAPGFRLKTVARITDAVQGRLESLPTETPLNSANN